VATYALLLLGQNAGEVEMIAPIRTADGHGIGYKAVK